MVLAKKICMAKNFFIDGTKPFFDRECYISEMLLKQGVTPGEAP